MAAENAPSSTYRDLLVDSFDRHLLTAHASLWGRSYDIFDSSSRRAAAVWFVDQIAAWVPDE